MAKSLKPLKTLAGGLAGRFASRNNRYGDDWALAHLYDEVFGSEDTSLSISLGSEQRETPSDIEASISRNFHTQLQEGLRDLDLSDDVLASARIDIGFTLLDEKKALSLCRIDVVLVDFLGKTHTQTREAKVIPQSRFGPR